LFEDVGYENGHGLKRLVGDRNDTMEQLRTDSELRSLGRLHILRGHRFMHLCLSVAQENDSC